MSSQAPKIKRNKPTTAVAAKPSPPAPSLMSQMRGISTQHVGRDPTTGKVIPHQYSQPVADLISRLVACGASEGEIAIQLNIRPGLLRKHYAKELDSGAFPHNMEVASTILQKAKDGDLNAGIYWTKARMKWRDGGGEQQTASLLNIHIHV